MNTSEPHPGAELADGSCRCPACQRCWPQGEMVEGLCPACLAGNFLNASHHYSESGWGKSWEPPKPEELQPLFADYEIEALIGRGGMGAVYRAVQKKLKRTVAVKILPPDIGWNPELKIRFLRETLLLARLNYSGIVTIHDTGESQGLQYLVMEHVEGQNLRQYMEEHPLSPRQALSLGISLCRIMEAAHAAGIVHRDLKPENILVPSLDLVKVADFGIAKFFGEQPPGDFDSIQGTSGAAGTGSFMAPEQESRPDQVDLRADIYALGVILYLLLARTMPAPIRLPPSQVRPEAVGPHVDAAVLRAINPDPARRQQSMQELRLELEQALAAEILKLHPPLSPRQRLANAAALVFAAAGAALALWGAAAGFLPKQVGLRKNHPPAAGQPFAIALYENVALELRPIPAGKFEMGSPPGTRPERHPSELPRSIVLSSPFWMGKYEITQAQYLAITGQSPSFHLVPGSASFPVESISWEAASKFCDALNWREEKAGRLPKGYVYRLPTEAEWEYAAQAGHGLLATDAEAEMDKLGWDGTNSGNASHPAGLKPANAWGLHDMYGNVSEWCLDSWHDLPGNVSSPADPVWMVQDEGSRMVCRGGNFNSLFFRSSFRERHVRPVKTPIVGFRVVLAHPVKDPDLAVAPALSLACQPLVATPVQGRPYALPLPDRASLEMLALPAGEFLMGKSLGGQFDLSGTTPPQHRVKMSAPFWMGRCEVTQAQYRAVMGDNPSKRQDLGPDIPVESVSWYAVMAFCHRLNEQEKASGRLPQGYVYRLPTEAEWEYACRASGLAASIMSERRFMEKSGWSYYDSNRRPHPVGQKAPNAWGFCDMLGNVSEWCLDRCLDTYDLRDGAVDPISLGPDPSFGRMTCGGGYNSQFFSCPGRTGVVPTAVKDSIGFRIVLGREFAGVESPIELELVGQVQLEKLPVVDAQGFRKFPLESGWWRRSVLSLARVRPEGLWIPEDGESELQPLPVGVKENRFYVASEHDFDVVSQETELSCRWKVIAEGRKPGAADRLDFSVGYAAQGKSLHENSQATLVPGRPGRSTVEPDVFYRTVVLVRPKEGKIVTTLFKDGETTPLQQWEAPITGSQQADLHFTQVRIERNGPCQFPLRISELLVRLGK